MMPFKPSEPLTLGVELELQLIDPGGRDLTPAAPRLLDRLAGHPLGAHFKPEITQSMIELNTGIHRSTATLASELEALRGALLEAAGALDVKVCGGGTHPFAHWAERRIFPTERFEQLAQTYGYLARRFTVFGQHVHVGCPDADAAVYLAQQLLRYVPHLAALSASSPYFLGVDTGLDCSRLGMIWAFPLSGHMPPLRDWAAFEAHFSRMVELGVAESIKDLYWDVRPKPEFGTVELRVADTPVSLELATDLAAYAQAVVASLLAAPRREPDDALQLVHRPNLFRACRRGFEAELIDPFTRQRVPLRDDLLATLDRLAPFAAELGSQASMSRLRALARSGANGAAAARGVVAAGGSLADWVDLSCRAWSGDGG